MKTDEGQYVAEAMQSGVGVGKIMSHFDSVRRVEVKIIVQTSLSLMSLVNVYLLWIILMYSILVFFSLFLSPVAHTKCIANSGQFYSAEIFDAHEDRQNFKERIMISTYLHYSKGPGQF
jgi:hypothetical protein